MLVVVPWPQDDGCPVLIILENLNVFISKSLLCSCINFLNLLYHNHCSSIVQSVRIDRVDMYPHLTTLLKSRDKKKNERENKKRFAWKISFLLSFCFISMYWTRPKNRRNLCKRTSVKKQRKQNFFFLKVPSMHFGYAYCIRR